MAYIKTGVLDNNLVSISLYRVYRARRLVLYMPNSKSAIPAAFDGSIGRA